MSEASRKAWNVCAQVIGGFRPDEQALIKTYFTAMWDDGDSVPPIRTTAERYGLTEGETRRIIDRAVRMVAVKRGLADDEWM